MAERIVSPSEQEPNTIARLLYPNSFFEISMDYYDDLVGLELTKWKTDEQKKDALTEIRRNFVAKNVDKLSLGPDKNIYCLVEFWDDPDDEIMKQLTMLDLSDGSRLPSTPSFNALKERVAGRGNTLRAFHVHDIWTTMGEHLDIEEQKTEARKRILGAFAEAASGWRNEDK
jgi:hypothetical protein